ncbi:MAG: 30S ribosomal protein S19e [Candidatus Thermoplasmatota archaeon]
MTTVYDIPAEELIDKVAEKLKSDENIKKPEYETILKTGMHKENLPQDKDWWFKRVASILRKVYIKEGIGVRRLQAEYSGKRNCGSKPNKSRRGSGAIIREAVQQLEKAGYVKKIKGQGRVVTSKGRSFLDNTANEVFKKVEKIYPGLKKY